MSGPGNPRTEDDVKKLLVSVMPEDQDRGLTAVVRKYQDPIVGRLRQWSDANGWQLDSHEIKDCWQSTMHVMTRIVISGKFKMAGSLPAFLATIAFRRAIDHLRKRIKAGPCIDPTTITDEVGVPPPLDAELREEFNVCFKKMHAERRKVVTTYIDFYVHYFPERVPLGELTAEVNERYSLDLSQSTVRSQLHRGRGEFRVLLTERGSR